jgi:heme exporter protein D
MANWFLIGTTIATLVVFAIDTVQGRRQNLRHK